MSSSIDPTTTKYLIRAELQADGVVEKPDVVGAIFGQTEGLLGNELDLRDLQKSGRIGRIEANVESKKGKSGGEILMPSSLDKVETAILAAALESIDRVGPCKAEIRVKGIEDVRVVKRKQVVDRARELLQKLHEGGYSDSEDITELVRDSLRVEEVVSYGQERLPAGPNVSKSDSIVVVEGRNDVINLLKHGIKNAIAVEGTSVPQSIVNLCKEKSAIAFVDGDRGGELILKELLQTAEVDFIARAPRSHEVEELSQKQIMKCLRNKIPAEQFTEMYSLNGRESRDHRDNVRGRGRDQRPQRREADDADYVQATSAGRGQHGEMERRERRDDRRDRDDRREDRRDREERRAPEPRAAPPARAEVVEAEPVMDDVGGEFGAEPEPMGAPRGEREGKFLEILDELSGKLQAVLLGDGLAQVGDRIAVRDLADTLKKEGDNVQTVVFDGVITQRLLDIAADKKIATLVGVKTGNITKKPESVEVVTKADLA